MDVKPSIFWRKSYRVQAVRITTENIENIANELELEYISKTIPYLTAERKGFGHIGDWVVVYNNDDFEFFKDEEFAEDFRTHSEQLSTDEKYAKVYELVIGAMRKQDAATYHGDSNGMDLVAIETTKKILNEL